MLEHPDITQCLRTGYPLRRTRPAPVCDLCGCDIDTEEYLEIFGKMICWDCVEKNRQYTDDWEPDSDE